MTAVATAGTGGEGQREDVAEGSDLLTIAEAAELLKVSAVTVSRWRRQGRLPTLKVGPRAVRIRRSDLDLVSQPYSGPASTLDEEPVPRAAQRQSPSSADRSVNTPSVPEVATVPLDRTMARAALLRSTILTRRRGEYLDPAGEDLGKLRDKRAKRRH